MDLILVGMKEHGYHPQSLPSRLGAFDLLRGMGILGVLFLHFSLYNFGGLLSLDMSNPPLIIKVMGFALMWASLFAVISGAVLVWSTADGVASEQPAHGSELPGRGLLRRKLSGGLLILATAYLYFLILGPGLIDFAHKSVDRSVLVALVVEGRFVPPSLDRVLYVDSLVMIGLNLLVLSPLVVWFLRRGRDKSLFALSMAGALVFLASGLIRIPLFALYEDLAKSGSVWVFPFNFLVNKNNPLLPFLGFGFLGTALGLALRYPGRGRARLVGAFGAFLLAGGVAAYMLLPDTMLKRSIDETWFCIMLIQAGFLTLVVLTAGRLGLRAWRKHLGSDLPRSGTGVFSFVRETGRVSLSVFLAEPVLTGIFGGLFTLILPGWNQGIGSTLAGGALYLLIWIGLLLLWRLASWRFGLEWSMARILGSRQGASTRWPIKKA